MFLNFLHCFTSHTSSQTVFNNLLFSYKVESQTRQLWAFSNIRFPIVQGRASHPTTAQALWYSLTTRNISSKAQEKNLKILHVNSLSFSKKKQEKKIKITILTLSLSPYVLRNCFPNVFTFQKDSYEQVLDLHDCAKWLF